jgi:hypothetical protein
MICPAKVSRSTMAAQSRGSSHLDVRLHGLSVSEAISDRSKLRQIVGERGITLVDWKLSGLLATSVRYDMPPTLSGAMSTDADPTTDRPQAVFQRGWAPRRSTVRHLNHRVMSMLAW